MKEIENKDQKVVVKEAGETDRRYALAKLATIVGVVASIPSEWKKPMVDSVMLPSHAATSVEPPVIVDCPGLVLAEQMVDVGSGQQCPISFEVRSASSSVPVNILSISLVDAGENTASFLPDSFPVSASATSGVQVSVQVTPLNIFLCTPETNTSFVVEYNCEENDEVVSQTFDLESDVIPAADPIV